MPLSNCHILYWNSNAGKMSDASLSIAVSKIFAILIMNLDGCAFERLGFATATVRDLGFVVWGILVLGNKMQVVSRFHEFESYESRNRNASENLIGIGIESVCVADVQIGHVVQFSFKAWPAA